MTFIIVLIALLVERFFAWSGMRHWNWLCLFQRHIAHQFPQLSPYVIIALTVAPLLCVALLIQFLTFSFLFGFVWLILNIFILIYCLGPLNLWSDTFSSLSQLSQNDTQFSQEKLASAFQITGVADLHGMHYALIEHIFIAGYRRIFAVVFWYVLLGVSGAVFYRMIAVSAHSELQPTANVAKSALWLEGFLDWVPIRLFTFLFALGGHFVQVLSVWQKVFSKGPAANELVLTDCGKAAIGAEETVLIADGSFGKQAISLLDRVFVITLVILALIFFVL